MSLRPCGRCDGKGYVQRTGGPGLRACNCAAGSRWRIKEWTENRKLYAKESQEPPRTATVKELMDKARAAGHDALGLMNDPEALETLDRVVERRTLLGVREYVEQTLDASPIRDRSLEALDCAIAAREELVELLNLIDETRRGCECDYDYRCTMCSRLLTLKHKASLIREKIK